MLLKGVEKNTRKEKKSNENLAHVRIAVKRKNSDNRVKRKTDDKISQLDFRRHIVSSYLQRYSMST